MNFLLFLRKLVHRIFLDGKSFFSEVLCEFDI